MQFFSRNDIEFSDRISRQPALGNVAAIFEQFASGTLASVALEDFDDHWGS